MFSVHRQAGKDLHFRIQYSTDPVQRIYTRVRARPRWIVDRRNWEIVALRAPRSRVVAFRHYIFGTLVFRAYRR